MSLINDALKQARQAPPGNTPKPVTSLPPAEEPSSTAAWLIPVIVILLVAALVFIGWAIRHKPTRFIVSAPVPAVMPPNITVTTSVVAVPGPETPSVVTPPPENPAPVAPPTLPKLQGIFYSATASTAILDGKTVGPGDRFKEFYVQTISKYTVTLVGPDKKEYPVSMSN